MKKLAQGCARLALALFVLLLAACGGGGGGGGGGTDLSTAPGLALSPTSLSFTAFQNGALPPTQNIQITITNPAAFGIIVGFPPGVTPPTWVDQNSSFSCTPSLTSCTLVAALTTASLAPGTYSTTLRFLIVDSKQNPLAFRDLQVSYTIQALAGFAATPATLSFSQLLGAPAPASQNLNISELGGSSYAWNASVLYQSGGGWLSLNGAGSASGATLPTTLTVSVVPTLAVGTLNATIRMTGNGHTLDVPVSYTLSEPQVTRSVPTLTFNALRLGSAPPTQDVTLTTQSSLAVAYTVSVSYLAGASGWLNTPASGSAPGTLTFGVNTTTLAPGSYTANVLINTASQSLPVTVTYVVAEPTLTRSPAGLTFNVAAGGALPVSQDVTLSTQQSVSLDYSASISYGAGPATGWLSVTPASGTAPRTATVSVNTTALAPATYSATVSFTTAAQTVSVGVSYVVTASTLTFGPSSASFTIDTTSVAAALSQDIAVGSTGTALSWTASPSQPWVSVSPTSGTSGSSVTLSLVPAQLDTLDAGTRSATITFSYTPPGQAPTTAPLSVSLNLQIPKVTSVNPYVAISSTNLEVILRGTGFSNPGGTVVNFDGTPATNPMLVSDTELRVTYPSLAAGSYRVSAPNQLGNATIVRSTANLVVVDPPAYSANTLAYPAAASNVTLRVPLNITYDAERKAVLVGVTYFGTTPPAVPSSEILRYSFSGSAWSPTPSSVPVSAMHDIALTMDGKKLLATSGAAVGQFDPVTLAAGTSTSAQLIVSDFLNTLALANDGKAVVTTDLNGSGFTEAWSYSVADATLTPFPFATFRFSQATVGASADGSRVILIQSGVSPAQQVYQYTASNSVLSATNLSTTSNLRPPLSRNGLRILIGGILDDPTFNALGSITSSTAMLSPDATRAYSVSGGTLHTFNMNTFLEIGTGTLLPSDPGPNTVIAVSPDGGSLFIAGSDAIVVVPAP